MWPALPFRLIDHMHKLKGKYWILATVSQRTEDATGQPHSPLLFLHHVMVIQKLVVALIAPVTVHALGKEATESKSYQLPPSHSADWDVSLPVKHIKNDFKSDLTQWASHLEDTIKSCAYSSQGASWPSFDSLIEINSLGHLNAAVAWATLDCKVIWPYIDQHPMQETDLDGGYYTQSVATVDLQMVKACYCLMD
ncbi:hypothetical protein BDK51DRAFT_30664 [Blyttiomyces helicus]|uniref:Uncharacterized protein n=1 Tax=Blyttiomyces helicus TaxID=388810 RepID=A0A4P9WK29_9FUNG|nr:hypothetical protein BDK51DRAFT_30664 [Blyttiomyces helicus]|eukprot:RKO91500.1 hypothetical protein BDK51DRAFT_30664 [Blyttiomyces helicus]